MTCCELLDLICDYTDGYSGPEAIRDLEDHFKVCSSCAALFNTYKKTSHICRKLSKINIPEEVQNRVHIFLKDSINKSNT